MRAICLFTFTAAALLAAGCGGSTTTNDDNGETTTVTLFSIASLDGEIKNTDGNVNATGTEMNVGLLGSGRQCRAFATFDITQFNVNDNVNTAGVSLEFVGQAGSPFTTLGDIIVEDVAIAGSLTDGDYDLLPEHGTTTLNRITHIADVGVMLQAAITAGQPRITFRFRFANLVAPVGTFVTYATQENSLPPPTLGVVLGEPTP